VARPSSPPSPKPLPSKAAGVPYAGDESALVVMGRLTGAFGIQGWVKVRTFTETPGSLASYPRWWIRGKSGWQSAALQEFKVRPAAITAKLEGVEDRTGAELLRGCHVAVTRADLGEAGEGEFFWVDLEGLEVVNLQGESLGRVQELMRGVGRLTGGKFEYAEGWRRHLHLGFSATPIDPLREALGKFTHAAD